MATKAIFFTKNQRTGEEIKVIADKVTGLDVSHEANTIISGKHYVFTVGDAQARVIERDNYKSVLFRKPKGFTPSETAVIEAFKRLLT